MSDEYTVGPAVAGSGQRQQGHSSETSQSTRERHEHLLVARGGALVEELGPACRAGNPDAEP
jgi:hypothetical protein